jgi:hypothetical protein
MNNYRLIKSFVVGTLLLALLTSQAAFAQKIRVTKATPAWAERGTGTATDPLEVLIDGEGMVDISSVRFLVSGSRNDTGGIIVTRFEEESPERVRAYIVVEQAAALEYFDIEMTTLRGRRGKGNTLFKVVEPGGSPYSGENIDLSCALGASFRDTSADTVKSDGKPGVHPEVDGAYVDAEEKVRCRTGGTVQPNLSGLGLDPKLKGGKPIRKMDLVLTNFADPDGDTLEKPNGKTDPWPYLPASLFEEGPTWEDMEMAYLAVRPHRNDQDHIQLLAPGTTYRMAARFRVKPVDDHRYVINLTERLPEVSDDQFSGLLCHSITRKWPNDEIVKVSEDVTVYLWPDADRDGVADGYTVTTGAIQNAGSGGSYSLANPPAVTSAPRTAAICSQVGPVECNGAGLGEFCNFLGFADVQFTWHAENIP